MTKRVPFICGNWKMHKTVGEAVELVDAVMPAVASLSGVEVGVAPPFTALHPVGKRLANSKVVLAAQNCHFEREGAYTGEVSVGMLKDVGVRYAIVGHSERRTLFGETNESCAKKVNAALGAGLRVIYCLGETLEEREGNKTIDVVTEQFKVGLSGISADQIADVVVAYEPVWAIGTGKTATPAQAQEVHAHLRKLCGEILGTKSAEGLRIQYGGSMKPENAKDLLGQPDIDGGLIGGASLKADAFAAICRAAT